MNTKFLMTIALTGLLAGCSATTPVSQGVAEAPTITDSRLADCALPDAEGRGPIRPSLYVVGTFPQSQWIHDERHKMSYKGDGIYQVVTEEKAGNVSLQFATMSWNPQFTVKGLKLPAGVEKVLKKGGFAKDTVASLPEDGTYVWSVQFSADKKPLKALVVQCKK